MAIPDVSARPLTDLISLAGRKAVVTGGARGIGYAISRRLAEAGAAVLIADQNEAHAEAAAATISADGGNVPMEAPAATWQG
jgi:NAD(P)-dependent dehydrogenase (short-subunit alcohol dehydrogenase family)